MGYTSPLDREANFGGVQLVPVLQINTSNFQLTSDDSHFSNCFSHYYIYLPNVTHG